MPSVAADAVSHPTVELLKLMPYVAADAAASVADQTVMPALPTVVVAVKTTLTEVAVDIAA